jgi:hypothetical protein
MKRHLLGFALGMLAFTLSFVSAPRVFRESGRGSGAIQGRFCSIRSFSPTLGDTVTLWSCAAFGEEDPAREHYEATVRKYTIISQSDSRAVVSYFTGEYTGFCVLRLDGVGRNDICSPSLEMILEFEKQHFMHRE